MTARTVEAEPTVLGCGCAVSDQVHVVGDLVVFTHEVWPCEECHQLGPRKHQGGIAVGLDLVAPGSDAASRALSAASWWLAGACAGLVAGFGLAWFSGGAQ